MRTNPENFEKLHLSKVFCFVLLNHYAYVSVAIANDTTPTTVNVCRNFCRNGGTCIMDGEDLFCLCLEGFTGERCEEGIYMESKEKQLQLTLLSSVTSLLLTILILSVLVFIILYIYRNSKTGKDRNREYADELDGELLYVQEELDKLSPAEKNSKLARLSKMIEATARVALSAYPALVKPALISPIDRDNTVPRPSRSNLGKLHCGSAPSILIPEPKIGQEKELGKLSTSVRFSNRRGISSARFSRPKMFTFFSRVD